LAYIFLIIFFGTAAFAMYSLTVGLNKTAEVISAPVASLARQLSLEATPVVLPDPLTIVREIRSLAQLETASMSVEKIVTATDNGDQLFGLLRDELVFVAYGEATAGVNLAGLTVDDMVVVDPVTVMVHLPEGEIFHAFLDEERSYVANRDTPLLARAFNTSDPNLESMVRQEAQRQVELAAQEAGLAAIAGQNAQDYIGALLRGLGFENVIFTETTPPPAPAYIQDLPKGWDLATPAP
jgi:hypothetical protein